jgi:hypothetical protein
VPAHDEIFKAMKANPKGDYSPTQFDTLYTGFGFDKREGRHVVYTHREHRQLVATVARHRKLDVGYTKDAIKIIERLKELEGEQLNG